MHVGNAQTLPLQVPLQQSLACEHAPPSLRQLPPASGLPKALASPASSGPSELLESMLPWPSVSSEPSSPFAPSSVPSELASVAPPGVVVSLLPHAMATTVAANRAIRVKRTTVTIFVFDMGPRASNEALMLSSPKVSLSRYAAHGNWVIRAVM